MLAVAALKLDERAPDVHRGLAGELALAGALTRPELDRGVQRIADVFDVVARDGGHGLGADARRDPLLPAHALLVRVGVPELALIGVEATEPRVGGLALRRLAAGGLGFELRAVDRAVAVFDLLRVGHEVAR
ncbi:MAG: hypothetical protein U0235_28365 [Polyangiaceae bacterium]